MDKTGKTGKHKDLALGLSKMFLGFRKERSRKIPSDQQHFKRMHLRALSRRASSGAQDVHIALQHAQVATRGSTCWQNTRKQPLSSVFAPLAESCPRNRRRGCVHFEVALPRMNYLLRALTVSPPWGRHCRMATSAYFQRWFILNSSKAANTVQRSTNCRALSVGASGLEFGGGLAIGASLRPHRRLVLRPERHRSHHFFVEGHKAVITHEMHQLVEGSKLVIEEVRPSSDVAERPSQRMEHPSPHQHMPNHLP